LRRRLEQVQSAIRRVAASGSAAERDSSREANPAPSAADQVDANVERAQRLLATATERRRAVDQQYADHRVSRFQFHLARSRELLAQVELRRAEEEAEA